ncbi:MAG: class I SAM-dependent methyltransferase, partial [Fimbriimonadales bacterium]|nr:class I SAM-dependent methyltransferase [Fimbriimonadales bacterium]
MKDAEYLEVLLDSLSATVTKRSVMEGRMSRRPEYTFSENLRNGRHGWLRLTPAYSAKLVEERLCAYLGKRRVLDPFGGTGTTPLIAGAMGFEATATELNPFLVWLAHAKTRFYTPETIAEARKAAKALISARQQSTPTEFDLPPIQDIDRWWDPEPLHWLAAMRSLIRCLCPADAAHTDLLMVAFARCVIELSKASYHHPSVSFREESQLSLTLYDYDALFMQELEFVLRGASQNPLREAQILRDDARTLEALPSASYDLVITSPPYVNRVSYIRELRPYMYWLGYLSNGRDAGELDWQAIGGTWGTATSRLKQWEPQLPVDDEVAAIALRIREAHSTNGVLMANYVLKYFEDMNLHIQSLKRVLRADARIHYIVGNSSFYGVLVPAEQILARRFCEQGFENVKVAPLRKRNCKRELY